MPASSSASSPQDDEPVEFVCFASQHDNLIVPRDNQVLAGAEAVWFEKTGHLAMTASDEVLQQADRGGRAPRTEARDRRDGRAGTFSGSRPRRDP